MDPNSYVEAIFGDDNTLLKPQSRSPIFYNDLNGLDNISISDDMGIENLHVSSNPINLDDIDEEEELKGVGTRGTGK